MSARRKVGVPKRVGRWTRRRNAVRALYLLDWELETDLKAGPDPEIWDEPGDEEMWIEGFDDDLDLVQYVIDEMREKVRLRRAEMGFDSRLKALRNVTGRTPEEAAAFLAKADELERQRAAS